MKRYLLIFLLCFLGLATGCDETIYIPPALEEPPVEKPEEPQEPEPEPEPVIPYTIPVVRITTEDGAKIESKENYVKGTIRVEDPSKHFSDVDVFEASMRIRGRGNSTWGMPKKPYRIKLDENASIFGLAPEKDWVLLANYSDKTLLRNSVAMELSRICGMKWTPTLISVEVYLNDEYIGVYSFTEHKEVAEGRVEIDVIGENDNGGEALTGGYYLEIEEAMDETTCFKSRFDTPVMFQEPEVPTPQQLAYVKDLIDRFELAVEDIQNKRDYIRYRELFDVPSLINYYIIKEIAKDPDGNIRKSTFITKEKSRKMEMYHVWDFDITMGNCNYTNFEKPEGWQIKGAKWYNKMFQDPSFVKEVQDRWNELYPQIKEIPEYLAQQIELLDGAQDRNFERWDILGIYVWPNAVWLGSYEAEVEFFLDFYNRRIEWLDKNINAL